MRLGERANSRGAAIVGLPGNGVDFASARAAYVLAGDDTATLEGGFPDRHVLDFLVVQASYRSPLTDEADVVLPAPLWIEKSGTLVNSQGQRVSLRAAVAPPPGVRDTQEVLAALAG
jgi:NADH dehydrogenase/NADH:ubiquinone oxidoreductase subunit G